AFAAHRPVVSARSLERRFRRGVVTGIVASDLPVHETYVRALTARGAKLRGTSRWLNAASVEIPARLAAALSRLPFISRLEPVRLACVAGSKPGTYSGGAYRATVALGKTEWVPTETPVEMDYWQFGAEWADSLGADVISSSLGYSTFDSGYPSYTPADMDGRT